MSPHCDGSLELQSWPVGHSDVVSHARPLGMSPMSVHATSGRCWHFGTPSEPLVQDCRQYDSVSLKPTQNASDEISKHCVSVVHACVQRPLAGPPLARPVFVRQMRPVPHCESCVHARPNEGEDWVPPVPAVAP